MRRGCARDSRWLLPVCKQIYMCVHICRIYIYIYIYILHIHTHTHKHAYIHIHMLGRAFLLGWWLRKQGLLGHFWSVRLPLGYDVLAPDTFGGSRPTRRIRRCRKVLELMLPKQATRAPDSLHLQHTKLIRIFSVELCMPSGSLSQKTRVETIFRPSRSPAASEDRR